MSVFGMIVVSHNCGLSVLLSVTTVVCQCYDCGLLVLPLWSVSVTAVVCQFYCCGLSVTTALQVVVVVPM